MADFSPAEIGEIVKDPAQYEAQLVQIRGFVEPYKGTYAIYGNDSQHPLLLDSHGKNPSKGWYQLRGKLMMRPPSQITWEQQHTQTALGSPVQADDVPATLQNVVNYHFDVDHCERLDAETVSREC